MHTDSKKQPSPEKWLADLLSKALLLEYQQPKKPTKRKAVSKKARPGKKSSNLSLGRGQQAAVQPELVFSTEHTAVSRYLGNYLSALGPAVNSALLSHGELGTPWQLEDVPVFQLFTKVRHLLGR